MKKILNIILMTIAFSSLTLFANEKSLIIDNCNEGIKITFPTQDLKKSDILNTRYIIDRTNKTTGKYDENYIIIANRNEEKLADYVIDYFVTPGNEYEYKLNFESSKKPITAQSKILKAENGAGDLEINPESGVIEYNEKKSLMKVKKALRFKNEKFIKSKLGTSKFVLRYSDDDIKKGYFAIVPFVREDSQIIDSSCSIYNQSSFNKNLPLHDIRTWTDIGEVSYYVDFHPESGKSIPQNVIVADLKKSTKKGISFRIPKECGATQCTVTRYKGYNKTYRGPYDKVFEVKVKENNYFIDKDVEPGEFYSYSLHYSSNKYYIPDLYVLPIKAVDK